MLTTRGDKPKRKGKVKTMATQTKDIEQNCEAAEQEFTEVRMKYSQYKNEYSHLKTAKGSYDPRSKTVIVFVPNDEEVEVDETPAWVKVRIFDTQIEVETANSKLLKMPKKGKYPDFTLWVPEYLFDYLGKSMYEVSFNPGREYKIQRTNRRCEVIEEIKITGEEVIKEFNHGDCDAGEWKWETHVPQKLEAVDDVEVPGELRDDEE